MGKKYIKVGETHARTHTHTHTHMYANTSCFPFGDQAKKEVTSTCLVTLTVTNLVTKNSFKHLTFGVEVQWPALHSGHSLWLTGICYSVHIVLHTIFITIF